MDTHTASVDERGILTVEPGLVLKLRSSGEYSLKDDLLSGVKYSGHYDTCTDEEIIITDASFDRQSQMIRDHDGVYKPSEVLVHFKVRSDRTIAQPTYIRVLPPGHKPLLGTFRSHFRSSNIFLIDSTVYIFLRTGEEEYLFRFIDGELNVSRIDSSHMSFREDKSCFSKLFSKFIRRSKRTSEPRRIIRSVAAY